MTLQQKNSRLLLACSLTGLGLWMAPGCAVSSSLRHEPDHVYSETTPQMLEQQSGARPLPPRAKYPDDQTTASTNRPEEAAGEEADGVARMGGIRKPTVSTAMNSKTSQGFEESLNQQSQFTLVGYNPDQTIGHQQLAGGGFHAAEPRLESDPDGRPLHRMETVSASPLADLFPDEYVFDGGDRGLSAAMHTNRSGLDTEDTVAAFADHKGERRTTPSNRVAVYAPRFGSVRTVTGLVADTKVDKAAGAKDSLAVGNLKTGKAAQENVHDTSLYGLETRDRVDGMKGSTPPMQARRTENAGQSRKVEEGHEGRNYSGSGTFNRNDGIIVAEQMRNAASWTRDQFPVISAVTNNAAAVSSKFKVQQTIGVKDERETTGNVHIVKLADRDLAQSGETITFTIRFQNTGDFDVYDVIIVDNLTPRLQYLAGSAIIDKQHPGEVSAEPNGEGSEILTFKLDQPLKGHESGTITFEATVR